MLWSRKAREAQIDRQTRPPTWREIIEVSARHMAPKLAEDWIMRLVAGCESAGSNDAAIDFLEREFDQYKIAYHAAELTRLTITRGRDFSERSEK